MRFLLIPVLVLVATSCHAADDPGASGRLDGKKVQFPAKSVAAGVKATLGLLESCHDSAALANRYTIANVKQAQKGDHIRLVFPRPTTVRVLGEKIEVSELVLTLPLNTGVFWLRSGTRVVRCSKYEFQKERALRAWLREAQTAD